MRTRFVAIVSGKGGVGKTTTTINLGAALNYFGRDVTIVDTNLNLPSIGLSFGNPNLPINLHKVLQGHYHISEATYLHGSGIKIIPASLSVEDYKKTNIDKLEDALFDLKTEIALLDCPPGLSKETLNAINAADEVLIVTNPDLAAVTDALKTIHLIKNLKKPIVGVILTRYGNDLDLSVNNVENLLENSVIAVIPEDNKVKEAFAKKEPLVYAFPKSKAAIAYKKLAAGLLGQSYEVEEEKISFWKKLVERLRE